MGSMEILIADDHDLFRRGLRSFLESRPDWHVCGEAADGREAVAKAKELRPDVVLLDVSMPKMNGLEAARVIRKEMPDSNILIVSQNDANLMEKAALQAGAQRYIQKTRISPDLTQALEALSREMLSNDRQALNGDKKRNDATAEQVETEGESDHAREKRDERFRAMIDALPAAIYATDAEGWLTHFNPAAVRFCGRVPELGSDRWCVSWKILQADGTPIPHEDCPMAVALKEGRIIEGAECIAERPDGTRVWFTPHPRPLRDASGKIVGGINMLVDITERKQAYAALRESEEKFRKLSESLDAEVRLRMEELESRNSNMLKQSEQMRDLSQRLLRAQDEERRRIARELHDSAGQTLAVLEMNLARFLRQTQQNAPHLAQDAEETQQLVQQLSRDIRTTSYLLHPPLLDESGLTSALSWYIEGLRERSGLDIVLSIPEAFGRLPREVELAVFRLVQECLTNIHRHSGSKSASIKIAREGESVSIEVEDRGKGMSREKLAEIQSRGSGVGIRGMQERVRQLHGNMQIESGGTGTRILVAIPIARDVQPEERTAQGPLQAAL